MGLMNVGATEGAQIIQLFGRGVRLKGFDFSLKRRANEAIFQLMMLAYNLFLLFKMDFVRETEYRQQIKTFRLKYIFLAGKIIRTARSVVMKLSEKYPYREIYEKSLS